MFTPFNPELLDQPLHQLKADIEDKLLNQGPLPNGANFYDAELARFSDEEPTYPQALARAVHVLWLRWANWAQRVQTVNRTEVFEQSEAYRKWYERMVADGHKPTFGATVQEVEAAAQQQTVRPRRHRPSRKKRLSWSALMTRSACTCGKWVVLSYCPGKARSRLRNGSKPAAKP